MLDDLVPSGSPCVPSGAEALLLVSRAGGTPLYAYSRAAMDEAVRRVRATSPPGTGVYYSLKANPHPGVVNALSALVDGFDVCSMAEMETALNAGTPPERVLFTGPAKTREEAASALAAGVPVTVESLGQADLLAGTARGLGVAGRAVVRLNTPYPGRVDGAPASLNHFGVGTDDVAEVVRLLRGSPLALSGLHLFWGSQYTDAAVVHAARKHAMERAGALAAEFGLALDFVSIGGGIAMPWCSEDPAVDWAGLQDPGLVPALPDELGSAAVVCEYGRSLIGPAGSLLTTVLDTKTIDGRRYVLVDAGMNHVMLASRLIAGGGRGEPSVRVVAPPRRQRDVGPATVTGPLCSQLDVLAENVLLPEVEVGDLLVLDGVGAYGPSFSPAGFLSRDKAREVVF